MVDSFSYWTFCDVFEEEDIPKSLFHGGFGLLAYHQIKKPTYYLYQFFARLSGRTLFKDDDIHVVKKEYLQMREEKKKWILEHGMVIIRCHDMLDRIDGIGMPFALGEVLGFKRKTLFGQQ